MPKSRLFFSDYFDIDERFLENYGALNICIVSDLPLFIDPFLLFNSKKPEYKALHEQIVDYLIYLRDNSSPNLDVGTITNLYSFKEVTQNWLGFTMLGNRGSALGEEFAHSLNNSLQEILSNFGQESYTSSSHVEKLALISPGVGRDNISDFTVNLIKRYLLQYTETFARRYVADEQRDTFAVKRSYFNYATHSWVTENYMLPRLGDDYVLLTPKDILTRDETWINHRDMLAKYQQLPAAIGDNELRAQINRYFGERLGVRPNQKERRKAAAETIKQFKELVDVYIGQQEERGPAAQEVSNEKVSLACSLFIDSVRELIDELSVKTKVYEKPWTSYDEARQRVFMFKQYVENQDGYQVLNRGGKIGLSNEEKDNHPSNEKEVQLYFGLVWCNSDFDVNREVNNGRGPVDFKASYGAHDKSLIEFKLARSSSLKRNLEKQLSVYEAANQTRKSLTVIVVFTENDQVKLNRVLGELQLTNEESIIVIDARRDNKISGSKA
ncbi:hypothetical protein [Kocuria sp. CPCC 205263]|uniref:hypothetical protein n=1 Tax=Kocuria sp. CPCC 205263 TaxID=3073555 RepID=UPI0034D5685F